MADDPNPPKEAALRLELVEEMRKSLADFVTRHQDYGTTESLMICFEVLAFQMGYFDSLCDAVGITMDVRRQIVEDFSDRGHSSAERVMAQKTALYTGTTSLTGDTKWKN